MMQQLQIPPLPRSERLDLFISRELEWTRAKVKNLLTAGLLRVNGKTVRKAGILLRGGEKIAIDPLPVPPSFPKEENIPLQILYEDESFIAVNKPAGLVVHPAVGHWEGTLVNALLYHTKNLSQADSFRPGIVHRLDKDTSGILLVAKNEKTHQALSRQFQERKVEKVYLVLAQGNVMSEQGKIEKPVGRHPVHRKKMAVIPSGRSAVTRYKTIKRFDDYTLLECRIETGRTHQIRVHLASLGHPVAGDATYGKTNKELSANRQLLHAWKIIFQHPNREETVRLEAPLPADFQAALDNLARFHW